MKIFKILMSGFFIYSLSGSLCDAGQKDGEYSGIGIIFEKFDSDNLVKVKRIIDNSPASLHSNLHVDDILLAVKEKENTEWVAINDKNFDNIISMIKGKPETKVGLKLQSETGDINEIFISRASLKIP